MKSIHHRVSRIKVGMIRIFYHILYSKFITSERERASYGVRIRTTWSTPAIAQTQRSFSSTRPGPLQFKVIHEGQQLIARRLPIASGEPSKHALCDDHRCTTIQEFVLVCISRLVSDPVDQRTKEHKQRPHGTLQRP